MLFNSSVFLVFFAAVYAAYLLLRRHHRLQNRLLLVASYVFYGWWDWRFLSLIVFSTCVDYVVGQRVHESEDERVRRRWLWVSVGTNLGLLAVFKYLGFFVDSAVALAAQLGWENAAPSLAIVLPVGISFYTFQTLSYTIDIHRRKLEPTRDVLDFALFVAFFPQLVAGPIERASAFLPQIAKPRKARHRAGAARAAPRRLGAREEGADRRQRGGRQQPGLQRLHRVRGPRPVARRTRVHAADLR